MVAVAPPQPDPFQVAISLASKPAVDPFIQAQLLAQQTFNPVASCATHAGARRRFWDGDKFPGSYGFTNLLTLDYWSLRKRSDELFHNNLYARGLIRRMVTNVINTGLMPELEPNDTLIPLSEDEAEEWAENVESRFEAWATTPRLCDFEGRRTYAKLQADAKREAMVEGDVLTVLRTHKPTGLPQIQLIRGGRVRTPLKPPGGKRIKHGVQLDARGRTEGFWITKADKPRESEFVPAFGPKSKKRLAWLIFGTEKRTDAVRGTPLLSLILQSIKEMDRYRDSEQRAATVNSLLAMFIERTGNRIGTNPVSGGAVMNRSFATEDPDRNYNITEQWPGIVMEQLAAGEKPVGFDTKRPNVNYAVFESAVVSAIAWANEIPPEILMLQFGNNYSASKAAISEFRKYIVRERNDFGFDWCQPVMVEWLIAEVVKDRIEARGFLESALDPLRYAEFGGWTRCSWGGPMAPSIELHREVKAYVEGIDAGIISHDRASKDLFGVRNSRVVKRLKREKEMMKDLQPDPVPGAAPAPVDPRTGMTAGHLGEVIRLVRDDIDADGDEGIQHG